MYKMHTVVLSLSELSPPQYSVSVDKDSCLACVVFQCCAELSLALVLIQAGGRIRTTPLQRREQPPTGLQPRHLHTPTQGASGAAVHTASRENSPNSENVQHSRCQVILNHLKQLLMMRLLHWK